MVDELKIDPRRIVPVGKGEAQPAKWLDPLTLQTHVLTEEFIQSKKDDNNLFEYLHQLNRRTEGKIIQLDFDPKTAPQAPKSYQEFQPMPK